MANINNICCTGDALLDYPTSTSCRNILYDPRALFIGKAYDSVTNPTAQFANLAGLNVPANWTTFLTATDDSKLVRFGLDKIKEFNLNAPALGTFTGANGIEYPYQTGAPNTFTFQFFDLTNEEFAWLQSIQQCKLQIYIVESAHNVYGSADANPTLVPATPIRGIEVKFSSTLPETTTNAKIPTALVTLVCTDPLMYADFYKFNVPAVNLLTIV